MQIQCAHETCKRWVTIEKDDRYCRYCGTQHNINIKRLFKREQQATKELEKLPLHMSPKETREAEKAYLIEHFPELITDPRIDPYDGEVDPYDMKKR